MIAINLYNKPFKYILILSLFYKWAKWVIEKSGTLCKITVLIKILNEGLSSTTELSFSATIIVKIRNEDAVKCLDFMSWVSFLLYNLICCCKLRLYWLSCLPSTPNILHQVSITPFWKGAPSTHHIQVYLFPIFGKRR